MNYPSYIPTPSWDAKESSSSYKRAGTGIVPSTGTVYRFKLIFSSLDHIEGLEFVKLNNKINHHSAREV